MWVAFVAWMTVIGGSYAYMWNGVTNEEVKTAIIANDYASFVESAPSKMLQRIDSEEKFTQFAQLQQEKEALQQNAQEQILVAVQAKDFTAFQKVQTDTKAKMKELHDAVELVEWDEERAERTRPEPTEEQIAKMEEKQLEHFNEIVAYYEENGTLPEMKSKRWRGKWMRKWKRGGWCDSDHTWGKTQDVTEVETTVS